jgi:hypothetical protein
MDISAMQNTRDSCREPFYAAEEFLILFYSFISLEMLSLSDVERLVLMPVVFCGERG